MEIFPSEYQSLDLNRQEKIFVRHASDVPPENCTSFKVSNQLVY